MRGADAAGPASSDSPSTGRMSCAPTHVADAMREALSRRHALRLRRATSARARARRPRHRLRRPAARRRRAASWFDTIGTAVCSRRSRATCFARRRAHRASCGSPSGCASTAFRRRVMLALRASIAAPLGFKRVDVVTREVPEQLRPVRRRSCRTTPRVARRRSPPPADLVLALSNVGARHADLNVKNILLHSARDDGTLEAIVLDVDRVTFDEPEIVLELNLARLLRSARKWQSESRRPVTDAELDELAGAVRERRPPPLPIEHFLVDARSCDRSCAPRRSRSLARARVRREPRAKRVVAEQRGDRVAECGRDCSARRAVRFRRRSTTSGMPPARVAATGHAEHQRVEQHRPHALFARAETRDVGRRRAARRRRCDTRRDARRSSSPSA